LTSTRLLELARAPHFGGRMQDACARCRADRLRIAVEGVASTQAIVLLQVALPPRAVKLAGQSVESIRALRGGEAVLDPRCEHGSAPREMEVRSERSRRAAAGWLRLPWTEPFPTGLKRALPSGPRAGASMHPHCEHARSDGIDLVALGRDRSFGPVSGESAHVSVPSASGSRLRVVVRSAVSSCAVGAGPSLCSPRRRVAVPGRKRNGGAPRGSLASASGSLVSADVKTTYFALRAHLMLFSFMLLRTGRQKGPWWSCPTDPKKPAGSMR
jgi:hypothetical protein